MKTFQQPLSTTTTERYLKILRVHEQSLSLPHLKSLIRAHLHTIPYENFSKFYYAQTLQERGSFIPSTDEFLLRHMEHGWGGTCYPLNIHFSKLLRSIGYDCSLVRVNAGHIAIQVHFNQINYYVDVGYGCPLFNPIRLPSEGLYRFRKLGEEVIFRKLENQLYSIDRHADGKSFVKKDIDWQPLTLVDFNQDIEDSHWDVEDNKVMRRLSATIFKPRYCYYLNNETITRKNEYTKEVSHFKNRYDWSKKVNQVFGIEADIALDAANFLEQRGVQLF
ncbi:arylamine N-acetyltransferase [Pseudalkalibacillus sp. Hm43]|uniref:arylamine N-acetyltransferase n=1 Tax=Pseudalkalibacillus sp. Hm43 TaxID=3450742 RepID=UPI003F42DF51